MKEFIQIHPNDNVAVALSPLPAGKEITLGGSTFRLRETNSAGTQIHTSSSEIRNPRHQIRLSDRNASGRLPGRRLDPYAQLKTGLGELLTYTYDPQPSPLTAENARYFQGYRRKDGKVGIRNGIWIIPTVGCVNNIATAIERQAQQFVDGSVEEIAAFPHPYGCSQMGDDQEHTRQILADLINHPNAGGVLVLGLGCENSSIHELKKYIGDYDPNRVRFLVAQECEDEIADGLQIIRELAEYAGTFQREPIPASELVIGMKCGGSDGLSGITANPVVGGFSDRLIACGGTTILTEVPEMFGAETLLMNRCENEALFHRTVDLINDFKNYFKSHNQTIYENPSPGNKKGGISTLEDKSLGCTQKSGSAAVKGVLSYGEPVSVKD